MPMCSRSGGPQDSGCLAPLWYDFFVDVDRQVQAVSDVFDVVDGGSDGSEGH